MACFFYYNILCVNSYSKNIDGVILASSFFTRTMCSGAAIYFKMFDLCNEAVIAAVPTSFRFPNEIY
jgi:hypothetical protein